LERIREACILARETERIEKEIDKGRKNIFVCVREIRQ
jgi:hypothetical protein